MILSSILLFNNNPFQQSIYLTSANSVCSSVYSGISNITSYFYLRDINDELQKQNAALEIEVVSLKNIIDKVKAKSKRQKKTKKVKDESKMDMPSNSVYLFSLLLEAVTRIVKFICYVIVFVLTSIGLTILLNNELRELVFQIFGLK